MCFSVYTKLVYYDIHEFYFYNDFVDYDRIEYSSTFSYLNMIEGFRSS